MVLAQRCWVAVSKEDPAAAADVFETVKERNMAPWFAHLSSHHPALFPPDAELLVKMNEANDAENKRISEVNRRQGGTVPSVPRCVTQFRGLGENGDTWYL